MCGARKLIHSADPPILGSASICQRQLKFPDRALTQLAARLTSDRLALACIVDEADAERGRETGGHCFKPQKDDNSC